MLLNVTYIQVELVDVLGVLKDEGMLWVEPEGDDVFDGVLHKLSDLVKVAIGCEHVLIIITYLNNYLDTKCLLEVARSLQNDTVAKVEPRRLG